METGYNLVDTAKLLGLSVNTVRYWVRIGRIRARKITGSRRWIVMQSEIERLQGNENAD